MILLARGFQGEPQLYDQFYLYFPVHTEKVVIISVREMVLIFERPRRIARQHTCILSLCVYVCSRSQRTRTSGKMFILVFSACSSLLLSCKVMLWAIFDTIYLRGDVKSRSSYHTVLLYRRRGVRIRRTNS